MASVNRGCSALRQCGVSTVVEDVGMTRNGAPFYYNSCTVYYGLSGWPGFVNAAGKFRKKW